LGVEIRSQDSEETRDDWRRYPTRPADGTPDAPLVVDRDRWQCRARSIPDAIAEKLRATVRALGMVYAGVDLILTPTGEFVFLEANASPAFGFAEDLAGVPVSAAVADLMATRDRDG
jgi:hypothetical protein